MAESISATEFAEEKMLVEDKSQNNIPLSNKDEFILEFDPRPQRTLRLNRRGFFLLNHEDDKESNGTSLGAVNSCKQNHSKKSEASHDRLKSPPCEQKIIKLTSKMSVSKSQNCLKRSSNDIPYNGMEQEPPPKKKHKPITWP